MMLLSGYRIQYDPTSALDAYEGGDLKALDELWENLYHQGDVDTASYSSVPRLVELGELYLVAAIEVARQSEHNPPLPEELKAAYFRGLKKALEKPPNDEEMLKAYYVIHSSAHGQLRLARVLDHLTVQEFADELL